MSIVQRIAGTNAFLRVAPHFVPGLDRFVQRVTKGKVTLSGSQVPSLMLRTTGAKSGQPRDAPLACLPDGDGWYVVGSNFGREKHPAWTGNLLADPEATVVFRGRRTDVRARLLDADEKAAVWPRLVEVWPTYDRYVERSGRDLRVFRLDPR